MNNELVRIVDAISRDKSIDKENIFQDLEAAMATAARRTYGETSEVQVVIDRLTGDVAASVDGNAIDMKDLGRIAAQTAKQVMIQKIREDERISIFDEYSKRVGTVVTGTITRYEPGGMAIVNLGRAEGVLPRGEQLPGETYHPGDRARAMILDVREAQAQVRIVLTRSHPDYIRRLFELEVPEVGERIIEIRALAREPGYRTKVAVSSIDTKVDAVGACVGVRGSRIRNIVEELNGEKIDIVRWNESSQILITNALKPAEVKEVFLNFELGRATVVVADDQLSLAIGKRGQNVRLASRLTGWDVDIRTPAEYDKGVDDMQKALKSVEGVDDILLDKMLVMGIISLADLAAVGPKPLVEELEVPEDVAARVIETAEREAARIAAEVAAAKAAAQKEAAERAAREAEEARKAAELAAAGDGQVPGAEPAALVAGEATSEAIGEATGEAVSEQAPGDETPTDEAPSPAGGEVESERATEGITPQGEQAWTQGTFRPAGASSLDAERQPVSNEDGA